MIIYCRLGSAKLDDFLMKIRLGDEKVWSRSFRREKNLGGVFVCTRVLRVDRLWIECAVLRVDCDGKLDAWMLLQVKRCFLKGGE